MQHTTLGVADIKTTAHVAAIAAVTARILLEHSAPALGRLTRDMLVRFCVIEARGQQTVTATMMEVVGRFDDAPGVDLIRAMNELDWKRVALDSASWVFEVREEYVAASPPNFRAMTVANGPAPVRPAPLLDVEAVTYDPDAPRSPVRDEATARPSTGGGVGEVTERRWLRAVTASDAADAQRARDAVPGATG